MKLCDRCLKALESREGYQSTFSSRNLDNEKCDCCGDTTSYFLHELLAYEGKVEKTDEI